MFNIMSLTSVFLISKKNSKNIEEIDEFIEYILAGQDVSSFKDLSSDINIFYMINFKNYHITESMTYPDDVQVFFVNKPQCFSGIYDGRELRAYPCYSGVFIENCLDELHILNDMFLSNMVDCDDKLQFYDGEIKKILSKKESPFYLYYYENFNPDHEAELKDILSILRIFEF